MEDQNGIPHCVSCHEECPYNIPDDPRNYICGSDGRTYNNTCDLKAAICRKGQSITVAYKGPCIGKLTFESRHEISTIKASNQPAHMRSLIRAFAGRLNIL